MKKLLLLIFVFSCSHTFKEVKKEELPVIAKIECKAIVNRFVEQLEMTARNMVWEKKAHYIDLNYITHICHSEEVATVTIIKDIVFLPTSSNKETCVRASIFLTLFIENKNNKIKKDLKSSVLMESSIVDCEDYAKR